MLKPLLSFLLKLLEGEGPLAQQQQQQQEQQEQQEQQDQDVAPSEPSPLALAAAATLRKVARAHKDKGLDLVIVWDVAVDALLMLDGGSGWRGWLEGRRWEREEKDQEVGGEVVGLVQQLEEMFRNPRQNQQGYLHKVGAEGGGL